MRGAPDTTGRRPHDLVSEHSLFGAVLIDGAALDKTRDHVRAEDFAEPVNGHIFRLRCERRDAGEPIDIGLMRAVLGDADLGGITVDTYIARIAAQATTVVKRQVAQEYLSGETLHGLAKRHDLSSNLVRVWMQKYETGALGDDAMASDTIQAYEARIAALERPVGRQALELEFIKEALRNGPLLRSGPTSVIAGLAASALPREAA